MTIFFLILLTFILGDLGWGVTALLRLRRFPRPWRIVLSAVVVLFTIVQFAGFLLLILRRQMGVSMEVFFPKPLVALIYIWHCLVVFPMLLVWFLGRVWSGISGIVCRLRRRARAETSAPTRSGADAAPTMTRRDFLAAAASAAPVVAAIGITGLASEQWREFRLRRLTIPLPRLPRALDGLTIAQVSDLHVGIFTNGAVLEKIVEATNQLRADFVFLPGDLINYALSDLPAGLAVVKRLEARCGVFMCEGNHDLFEDPEAFRTRTAAAGVRLLTNETAIVPVRDVPVQILGLRWGWGPRVPHNPADRSDRSDKAIEAAMQELLPQKNPDAFPILLAHHPHAFDYAGDIPLTLAGHTHGGQLMLTKNIGFGPAMFRYWSGLYEKDRRALVVSNGVGNWFPVRVQAPAEIVHITLRAV